jgi:O-antigen ligase
MLRAIENKLLAINKVLLGLILLTPLMVSKWFIQPFEVPKVIYLRILVELALIFYLWLIIKKPQYRPNFKNSLVISLLIFTVILFVSGIFGVQFSKSFWGTIQRSGGIFNWLHILAFFLMLVSVLKEKRDWLKFLRLFSAISLIVAAYALAQKFGLGVYESGMDRVTGTIGNAALLSGYLIFGIYVYLYLFFSDLKSLGWRTYYLLAALFEFLVIAFSQTRGAMIGLVISLLLLLIFLSLGRQSVSKKIKQSSRIILLLLVMFLGGLFIAKDSAFVKDHYLMRRFVNISISDTTAQTRFYSWRGGWQAWQDKPILGWGIENYNIAYNNYFDITFYDQVRGETWFDRAHNTVVEYLTNTGIIGLISYLSIFIVLILALYKSRKNKQISYYQSATLFCLLAAYFIQNLLVFDSLSSLFSFAFIIALIHYLQNQDIQDEIKISKIKYGQYLIYPMILLFIWINVSINFPVLASTAETRSVLQEFAYRNYTDSRVYDNLKSSLNRNLPWDWEIIDAYVKPMMDIVRDPGAEVDYRQVNQTLQLLDDKIQEIDNPEILDAKMYQRFARIYALRMELDPDNAYYFEQAKHYATRGLEIGPNRLPTMYVLSQLYIFEEDYQAAAEILFAAIEANPRVAESYWSLALLYSAMEDKEKMMDAIRQSIEYGIYIRTMHEIEVLLPFFQEAKDYKTLEYLYTKILVKEPNEPQWYANLAAVYKELGDKEKAIETVNKILEIDANYLEQVQAFIDAL